MAEAILALNAGSSSLKFALFTLVSAADPRLSFRGEIETTRSALHFTVTDAAGETIADRRLPSRSKDESPLGDLLDWIERHLGDRALVAVGHRIVHGGQRFVTPVRLTPEIVAALATLTPLDPLHQPLGLAPIDAITRLRPDLAQFACFDTAFHHDLAPPVSRYALPLEYEAKGLRKYGFHGLSYEYIARRLEELSPHLAGRRTVVAHLGNGASLCAMRNGQSLDTTMGFSALDGLVMGTRSGAIDPGILLYLLKEEGLSLTGLEDLLYRKSGLLGVSGISGDMRALLASSEPRAKEAVDLFAFRAARDIAAMTNTLGGLELLVFTGGIGEHAAPIRAMISERLHWLGVAIDPAANDASSDRIDIPQSRVEVRVIPTDEELVIVRHVERLLGANPKGAMARTKLPKDSAWLSRELSPHPSRHVAMGDGLNEALAPRAADLDISVDNAVKAAKAAADIVLLERDINVLLKGIVIGQATFDNTLNTPPSPPVPISET